MKFVPSTSRGQKSTRGLTHQFTSSPRTALTLSPPEPTKRNSSPEVLHRGLLTVARDFGWQFEAWAVFSNHYHFVAHSPQHEDSAESLSAMLGLLHEKTAKWINRLDGSRGRQVLHNFWETKLTYQRSYLARLNYVHQNPVKHGLVVVANQYPWCSARWFELTARPAQIKTIYSLKTDRLKIYDEYEPTDEW